MDIILAEKNGREYFKHPMTAAQVIIMNEALYPKNDDEFMDQDRIENIAENPFG